MKKLGIWKLSKQGLGPLAEGAPRSRAIKMSHPDAVLVNPDCIACDPCFRGEPKKDPSAKL